MKYFKSSTRRQQRVVETASAPDPINIDAIKPGLFPYRRIISHHVFMSQRSRALVRACQNTGSITYEGRFVDALQPNPPLLFPPLPCATTSLCSPFHISCSASRSWETLYLLSTLTGINHTGDKNTALINLSQFETQCLDIGQCYREMVRRKTL
ncbi:hypothetical protein RRG08_043022 [Elysia crispata]|uniref:Uncharacterized protein n=1 Tax=Elysia crispata TaxID=231223 RepID=A0AAE1CP32_9GAST|nr:hypothetical protein RRG08_043022 [Elysia crispata]